MGSLWVPYPLPSITALHILNTMITSCHRLIQKALYTRGLVVPETSLCCIT